MEDEKNPGLSPKTFGVIIGVVVVAAVAMFVALYAMGAKESGSFNDGYDAYYDPMNAAQMEAGVGSDYATINEYPEGEVIYGEDYTEFYPLEADGFYYESTGTMEESQGTEDGFYPME